MSTPALHLFSLANSPTNLPLHFILVGLRLIRSYISWLITLKKPTKQTTSACLVGLSPHTKKFAWHSTTTYHNCTSSSKQYTVSRLHHQPLHKHIHQRIKPLKVFLRISEFLLSYSPYECRIGVYSHLNCTAILVKKLLYSIRV